MQQVEVGEIPGAFSMLLESVERGEEIIVIRDGKPVARLIPEVSGRKKAPKDQPSIESATFAKTGRTVEQKAEITAAIASIRARAERLAWGPFDFEQFKRDRDEGRL